MSEKILITGITGQIGSQVLRNLEGLVAPDAELYLLQHTNPIEFDTNNHKGSVNIISNPEEVQVHYALHFAANIHTKYSNQPDRVADFVRDNVDLTRRVVKNAGWTVMLSSDNVFNGMKPNHHYTENETVSPCNGYGWTKAWAEDVVRERGAVVRIQSLFGVPKNLIADRIVSIIEGKVQEKLWSDQYLRPTYFPDLLHTMRKLVQTRNIGIYHVSCEGTTPSRAQIGEVILEIYKRNKWSHTLDIIPTELCSVPSFPRYLALDTAQTRHELGIQSFTPVNQAVEQHLLALKRSLHNSEFTKEFQTSY